MKSFAGRAGAAGLCNDGSEQDTMMNLPINQIICGDVLDPFGGSGTVGVVAARLKRGYILIELNEKYVEEIAKPRLAHVEIGVPVMEQRAGQIGLFERRDTSDKRR